MPTNTGNDKADLLLNCPHRNTGCLGRTRLTACRRLAGRKERGGDHEPRVKARSKRLATSINEIPQRVCTHLKKAKGNLKRVCLKMDASNEKNPRDGGGPSKIMTLHRHPPYKIIGREGEKHSYSILPERKERRYQSGGTEMLC